jgi:uncharacterized protein
MITYPSQELTMKREVRVLRKATAKEKRRQQVTETCLCCAVQKSYCQELPRSLAGNQTQKQSLFWARVFANSSSGGSYSAGGSSSSCYSGGGSDFGRGSSGGGGAGGSW